MSGWVNSSNKSSCSIVRLSEDLSKPHVRTIVTVESHISTTTHTFTHAPGTTLKLRNTHHHC